MTATEPFAPLAAGTDRCDRCGAAAMNRVVLTAQDGRKLDLLFCGHHTREHEAKLKELGIQLRSQ